MKKIGLSCFIAGLLLANVAGADPVAVEDGTVFILSNGVLSAQTVNGSSIEGCELPPQIDNATDVVISGDKAFVTQINPNNGAVSVASVDVSSCLVSSNTCDFPPTADLGAGQLDIPCLEVNGKIYDIRMRQRGNSMNWEVTGIEDSRHSSRNR